MSAPSSSSSSSSSPPQPQPQLTEVAYELRVNPEKAGQTGEVALSATATVRELQRAVLLDLSNTLRGFDAPNLDVYPPGAGAGDLRHPGARYDHTIASVLNKAASHSDHTLVIVPRKPALGSTHARVQGQQPQTRTRTRTPAVHQRGGGGRERRGGSLRAVDAGTPAGAPRAIGGLPLPLPLLLHLHQQLCLLPPLTLTVSHCLFAVCLSISALQDENVPMKVRAVVGRLEGPTKVGTGVWLGHGWVVATEHQTEGDVAYYFSLLDHYTGQVTVRQMELRASDHAVDCAIFAQVGEAIIDVSGGTVSAEDLLHPAVGDPAPTRTYIQPTSLPMIAIDDSVLGVEVFCLSLPAILDKNIAAPPSSDALFSQPLVPVVTSAVLSGHSGGNRCVSFSHYTSSNGSSGGAVVRRDSSGNWSLLGIHGGIVGPNLAEPPTLDPVDPVIDQENVGQVLHEFTRLSLQSWEVLTESTKTAAEAGLYTYFAPIHSIFGALATELNRDSPNVQDRMDGQRKCFSKLEKKTMRVVKRGGELHEVQGMEEGEEMEVLEVLPGWRPLCLLDWSPAPHLPVGYRSAPLGRLRSGGNRGRTQSETSSEGKDE
jgi:hypothetical protein